MERSFDAKRGASPVISVEFLGERSIRFTFMGGLEKGWWSAPSPKTPWVDL